MEKQAKNIPAILFSKRLQIIILQIKLLEIIEKEDTKATLCKLYLRDSKKYLFLSIKYEYKSFAHIDKIIKTLTSNPAKILKINKGNLSVGTHGDFCIVDINRPWVVKKENLVSKSKNTSIEGRKLQGKVISTFVNGKQLFKTK